MSEPLGAESLVHLELPIRPVNTEEVREVARDADATVLQELRDAAETARTLFRARFTGSYRGRSGEPVEVAVDARRSYTCSISRAAWRSGRSLRRGRWRRDHARDASGPPPSRTAPRSCRRIRRP